MPPSVNQASRTKHYLGLVPSWFLEQALRSIHERRVRSQIIRLFERYPNYLSVDDPTVLVKTTVGVSLYCNWRDYIGQTLIQQQVWEPLVSRTIQTCLSEGCVAIDVGANIGYDSLLMAQKVGTSGLVLSFEPDWRNFQLFLRNLAQNNARNVVAHSVALGDHPRLAKLALGAQLGHSTLRADAHECAQVVSVLTLDGLASLLPRRGVRLMKMDVEGFEVAVVRGARDVLRETDLVICEVNHTFLEEANSSARELFEIMKSLGFASYCASLESDGQWVAADSTFIPSVSYSTGHTAFDALFCRDPDRLPRALVATW